MFLKREIRIGVAAVLVIAIALASAAPAGAMGWSDWGEAREWADGFVPRFLSWLGLGPMALPKCDPRSSIDPSGCRKADHGSQIDPNGNP